MQNLQNLEKCKSITLFFYFIDQSISNIDLKYQIVACCQLYQKIQNRKSSQILILLSFNCYFYINSAMSFEEKRQLCITINNLESKYLGKVIQILSKSVPNLLDGKVVQIIFIKLSFINFCFHRNLVKKK